ncbi:MAG: hypothetical protein COB23_06015 [Methylophaga sp.]|nr:MAG: hypothetical protein COB23_06015 [Methylophaga sp.]
MNFHIITSTTTLQHTITCYSMPHVWRVNDIESVSLSDVIHDVKTEKYKVVAKKNRPFFNPCIISETRALSQNYTVTGVVLFDLDKKDNPHKDIEAVRQQLIVLPEILFCFYSPSGGLKFAIYTDDELEDKKDYALVYLDLHERYQNTLDITLDKAMKNINAGSYYGSDATCYYNEHCLAVSVTDWLFAKKVALNTKDRQVVNAKQISNIENYKINHEDIEKALSYIPRDYSYTERMEVTFALLNVLNEQEVKGLLLSHWNKPDNTQEKHIKQIDNWTKATSSSNGITIKSLFYTAHKHGYIAPRRNSKPKITELKPTFEFDFIPAEHATEKLNAIVDDFFETKKDVFVNITAGAGKTDTIQRYLFNEFIVKGCGKRVTIFVKTHETAEEYIDKFNRLCEQYQFEGGDFRQKQKKAMLKGNTQKLIQHYKGRYQANIIDGEVAITEGSYCKHPLLVEDKVLFDKKISRFCCNCPLRVGCQYVSQFEASPLIRIVTHNDLFNYSSLWAGGFDADNFGPNEHRNKTHYLIVDEDIIGQVLSQSGADSYGMYSSPESIKNILATVRMGTTLREAINDNAEQLIDDYHEQERQLELYDASFDNLNYSTLDVDEIIKNYIPAERINYCSAFKPILQMNAQNDDENITNDGIWVSNDMLYVAKPKKLMSRFDDIPMMYLDATANAAVVSKVFGGKFDENFKQINVQPSSKVSITQYAYKTYSRSYFKDETDIKLERLAKQISRLSQGKKIGIITYRHIVSKLKGKLNNVVASGYFGNIRGLNRFEDVEQLYVIGRHFIGNTAIENMFRMLNYGFRVGDDLDSEFVTENNIEIFNLKDKPHYETARPHYANPIMSGLIEHFCRGETEQALHRLRMVHTQEAKELFLFTNEVQRVVIDRLIIQDPDDRRRANTIELIDKIEWKIKEDTYVMAKVGKLADAIGVEPKLISNHKITLDEHFTIQEIFVKDKRNGTPVTIKLYVNEFFTIDMFSLPDNYRLV